jgi:hypothetical protein
MSTDVLVERFRLEADLVARTTQEDGQNRRLEPLLLICKDLPAHARQAWESLWTQVRDQMLEDLQEAGESFLLVLDQAIVVVGAFAEHTEEPLRGIQADLEQLRQEHKDAWPWCSEDEMDEARAESARGETLELDEAFAEIAGVSREEWLHRVEQHKRRKGEQQGG